MSGGEMSAVEYARFLHGRVKSEFNCPVLVFGSSDPDLSVSVAGLRFNDYSCGMLIRPDGGATVETVEGMTGKERLAYVQETNTGNQAVLMFVDPLDALNFLSQHVMQALALVGEHQGADLNEPMDEMMEQFGLKARQELLSLRRAVAAYLKAATPEAERKARARLQKIMSEAQP